MRNNLGKVLGYRVDRSLLDKDVSPIILNSRVGLEIEVENASRLSSLEIPGWTICGDGSLRNGGREAKFSQPLRGKKIETALMNYECSTKGLDLDYSFRTSLHVHIDMTDMYLCEIKSVIELYKIFENQLYNYVREDRRNNNFCKRSSMSTNVCSSFRSISKASSMERMVDFICRNSTPTKYSGLNLKTLTTFGTLEYRMHQGVGDRKSILQWINILLCMKKHALKYKEDRYAVNKLREVGLQDLTREVFGEYSLLLSNVADERIVYATINRIELQGRHSSCLRGTDRLSNRFTSKLRRISLCAD